MKNKKALDWFNKLGHTRRQELALDYYGTELLMDDDIEQIYLKEYRYYIEFDGKRRFLCLFPAEEKDKNKDFKTLEEALTYMIEDCKIKEIAIKN
jgi:hypothetical protein|nr:MAG TPA: hypothetical protein [Caudoviricetes sp.]